MKFTTINNATEQTGLSYLGGINLSAKMVKNQKVGHYTYSLNLSPASTSGYNVCPNSCPECRMGCLATSGRAKVEIHANHSIIKNARIKKTVQLHEEQQFFMEWLIADLKKWQSKAQRDGFFFSARLNTISDVNWQDIKINNLNIFEWFPGVQFYDYTKSLVKFKNKPSNYHLTYSYTGMNFDKCTELLNTGNNVAMVFNVKKPEDLPLMYKGFKVVNGDETDYRPLDEQGVIIGLKWKRIANKAVEAFVLNSPFVIQPDNVDCTY